MQEYWVSMTGIYNYNYDDKINSAKAFALDFISSYREIVKREVNTIRA